jgi:hypothetical protein
MTTTETVTFIGIAVTFVVGVANLIVTLRSVRKTAFINSITASRIRYIQDLRVSISKLCSLAISYKDRISKLPYQKHFELQKEAHKLKYLIRLYLNPSDEYWDETISKLIENLTLKSESDPKETIDELITITQYLLKLEWEGAKLESKRGIVSDIDKKELYNKYVAVYECRQKVLKACANLF